MKNSACRIIDQGCRLFLYLLVVFLPTGKAVIEVCVAAGLTLWLVRGCVGCRSEGMKTSFRLPDTPLNVWIAAFLFVCLLSAVGSAFWEQSLRGLFSKTLEWFVIFFLFASFLKKPRHVWILVSLFLLTTAVTACDGLVQFFWTKQDFFFGRPLVDGYRVTAGLAHANSLAAYLTVSLPVTFSVFLGGKNRPWLKWSVFVLLLAQGTVLFLTFTRGAYLAAVLAVFLVLIKSGRTGALIKGRRLAVLLVILAAVLSGLMLGPQGDAARALTTTLEWRGEIWRDCLTMISRRPLLGHGPNTFMMLFPAYRVSAAEAGRPLMTYAHNCFLQLTAETGLLGLIMFLGMMGALFGVWSGLRAPGDRLSWLAAGIGAGLFGFLVHSAVDTHFYSLQLSALFWMFAGTLISISRMLSGTVKCDITRDK